MLQLFWIAFKKTDQKVLNL